MIWDPSAAVGRGRAFGETLPFGDPGVRDLSKIVLGTCSSGAPRYGIRPYGSGTGARDPMIYGIRPRRLCAGAHGVPGVWDPSKAVVRARGVSRYEIRPQ